MQKLYIATADFLSAGGPVLMTVLLVLFLLWLSISYRLVHLAKLRQRVRREKNINGQIGEWRLALRQGAWLIPALVMLCPLLGLLGTVTGMIQVFDVLAWTGSSNPQVMADGVARATLPTLAGMVAALSGLLMQVWLKRRTRQLSMEIENAGRI